MKDQITVTTVGTQYDEDHIVCITEEAKDLLTDALYAENNDHKNVIETGTADRFWVIKDDDQFAKEREKLRLAEGLVVQLDDMKVCDR